MGAAIAVTVALLILLWIVFAVRRRSLRTYLLATGTEVAGTASLVSVRGRRDPRIVVSYTDSHGVERRVVKAVASAGDSALARKPVRVVFHPRRTDRDDYVLVGFGEHPSTWFRVNFHRGPA